MLTVLRRILYFFLFFFNDTATTEIYTLSLHDALPICRDGRSFSVILLDLDGLKKINDAHGHVVGSLALCRMAEVLLLSCRAIDTPARYDGVEFALFVPPTSSAHPRPGAPPTSPPLSADVAPPR